MRLNIPKSEKKKLRSAYAKTSAMDVDIFNISTTKFNGIRIIYQEKLKNLLNLFVSVRWPNILRFVKINKK